MIAEMSLYEGGLRPPLVRQTSDQSYSQTVRNLRFAEHHKREDWSMPYVCCSAEADVIDTQLRGSETPPEARDCSVVRDARHARE